MQLVKHVDTLYATAIHSGMGVCVAVCVCVCGGIISIVSSMLHDATLLRQLYESRSDVMRRQCANMPVWERLVTKRVADNMLPKEYRKRAQLCWRWERSRREFSCVRASNSLSERFLALLKFKSFPFYGKDNFIKDV